MNVRREPVRTCVACREEAGKRSLRRIVRGPDGNVFWDPTGRASGRGAYLHDEVACRDVARKRRSLERALQAAVPAAFWDSFVGS